MPTHGVNNSTNIKSLYILEVLLIIYMGIENKIQIIYGSHSNFEIKPFTDSILDL